MPGPTKEIVISATNEEADWLHQAAPEAYRRTREADEELRELMGWGPLPSPGPPPEEEKEKELDD